MLKLAMRKIASAEEDSILQNMQERLKKLKGENAPKGLPDMAGNKDVTDHVYPTLHNQPVDWGWGGVKMITGNGGGPVL